MQFAGPEAVAPPTRVFLRSLGRAPFRRVAFSRRLSFYGLPLRQLYISSIASQGQFETLQLPLMLCPATSISRSLLQRNLFSALYPLALEIPAAFHDLSRGVVTVGTLEERGRRFFARQGG